MAHFNYHRCGVDPLYRTNFQLVLNAACSCPSSWLYALIIVSASLANKLTQFKTKSNSISAPENTRQRVVTSTNIACSNVSRRHSLEWRAAPPEPLEQPRRYEKCQVWKTDVRYFPIDWLTGYLADTHTGVALAVARKFRTYSGSNIPLMVCATAHYGKCLDEVLHAVTDAQPSVSKSTAAATAGRSMTESLTALQQQLMPGTRPVMHVGLTSLINNGCVQTVTSLPAHVDAIASHIRSLDWPPDRHLYTNYKALVLRFLKVGLSSQSRITEVGEIYFPPPSPLITCLFSLLLPSPFLLLEVGPLNTAKGPGEHCNLP